MSFGAPVIDRPAIESRVSLSPVAVTAGRQPGQVGARAAAGIVDGMAIDVTDATFESDVVEQSKTTPVVIDLWAPWCGPCQTLGPILEKVTDATDGKVVLAKVNIDENPGISQAFRVQSIPAVFAMKAGQVVDGFMGAYPEDVVEQFVGNLLPTEEEQAVADMIASGDEASLRIVLQTDPGNEEAIEALAEMLVGRGDTDEALGLLERIPENDRTRKIAAAARVGAVAPTDDHDATLGALLDRVKDDDEARQQFVDILELMGPDDPRTAGYRRQLTARLY
jgi:putative thioredoxin